MGIIENKKAILHCIDLYNECALQWVDECYSKELIWEELPTKSFPKGRCGGIVEFRKTASNILAILPNRKLFVLNCIAEDDFVMLEQEWKGNVKIAMGEYRIGEEIKMKIVTIFRLENGLIVEHKDYPISV